MDSNDSIAFLVHDIGRLMRARFDGCARELGATRQQWRVLLNLSRMGAGPTQAELAERLDVEQITLCRMIDRLADAGLVERRADPRDRRVRRLHLMPGAQALVEKLGVLAVELETEAPTVLDPPARAAFRDSLQRLREGLGRRDGEHGRKAA